MAWNYNGNGNYNDWAAWLRGHLSEHRRVRTHSQLWNLWMHIWLRNCHGDRNNRRLYKSLSGVRKQLLHVHESELVHLWPSLLRATSMRRIWRWLGQLFFMRSLPLPANHYNRTWNHFTTLLRGGMGSWLGKLLSRKLSMYSRHIDWNWYWNNGYTVHFLPVNSQQILPLQSIRRLHMRHSLLRATSMRRIWRWLG